MNFFFLIVALIVGTDLSQAGDFKVHIDFKDLKYDEKIMKLEVKTKRSDTKTTVNIMSEILADINDDIYYRLASYEKVDGKPLHLVNGTSSICNVMSRFKSHPIMKYVMDETMKSSNVPTSCPFKKGSYSVKDFTMNADLLQPFLPNGNFLTYFSFDRVVNGEELRWLSGNVHVDIENPRDKKGFKLF